MRLLMGFLKIFVGFDEILYGCPGDISWVSRRYLLGVLEIFDRCPGDIWWVSWKYSICVLEIFDVFWSYL